MQQIEYWTRRLALAAGLATSVYFPLSAQEKAPEKPKWDVTKSLTEVDSVKFPLAEGTWMNVDVSPDGKQIAFDLLGDIYLMPISGGKATLVSGGSPYEVQPRFSPDGKQLLFTSDRGGGDNIWVMNTNGTERKPLTKENFRLLNNPYWCPDGEFFVARKHFTSTRSLGAGEMWLFHKTGGAGTQLTKKRTEQKDSGEPCVSPDGRYVYFSDDVTPGGVFEYSKDPNGEIYAIQRYDRETGKMETITGGAGSACRPQVSPDGKLLAFVKRVRTKSVLYIHVLETGVEYPVYDDLSRDQQETWAIFGVYPNFNWLPDNKTLIFSAKGKIRKVNIETGKSEIIEFQAEATQYIAKAVHFQFDSLVDRADFEVKMIRHAQTSPDGNWLAFNAAGHIYLKFLPDGTPFRLTKDSTHFEFAPTFSADGKSLAYTTWSDEELGAIWVQEIATSGSGRWVPQGAPRKLTPEKGFYHEPSFSADGKRLVFRKGTGDQIHGYAYSAKPGIYSVAVSGGAAPQMEYPDGEQPHYSANGKQIYFLTQQGALKKALQAINLEDKEVRTLFTTTYASQFSISPDEKWLAFTELYQCYVAPFPKSGKEIDMSADAQAVPIQKITRDAGTSLHWSGDSKRLHWMLGAQYFTVEVAKVFGAEGIKADSLRGIKVGLRLKTDIPEGSVVFTNARIITMEGDKVIEKGYVLVTKNKIAAIGEGAYKAAAGVSAKVIDCTGKTLMPGIVDVHAHPGLSYTGISPQQQWSHYADLAFGVTTTHDPSNWTEMVFSQSEMTQNGTFVAPRTFSTGTILYGADGDFKAVINSLEDAKSHLRRLQAVGAFSVKSYNQPRREQRQQVMQAARELHMHVYPEGGSTFFHNMTQILDGHTGIEHSIPVYPIYEDVRKLWNASKTGYTPTLIVGYGGNWGENYWYQKTNVWENPKLNTFMPRAMLDARSRRRVMAPDDEFGHIQNSQVCKSLLDGGTKVQLGAHGQLPGLGAHWELWMLQQGGMTNLEAIRAATLAGAQYLGMDNTLGSLEVGKMADIVIMDKNPIENIRNTESISFVMKNGRLYDAKTMNEVGNYDRKRSKFYWERPEGNSLNFPWHSTSAGFGTPTCGCNGRQ